MGRLSTLGFILQFIDLLIKEKSETGIRGIEEAISSLFGSKKSKKSPYIEQSTGKKVKVRIKEGDRFKDLEAEVINTKPKITVKRVVDIDDRIENIINMIRKWGTDYRVRKLATRLLTVKCGDTWCIKEKDWEGEVKFLFDQVRRNVRYVRDVYDRDTFTSPLRTFFEFKAGDCDDYTILLGSLLYSIGYPIKLKVVQTRPNKTWNHIYLLVGLPPHRPTKWMSLDASQPFQAGWEVPKELVIRAKEYTV